MIGASALFVMMAARVLAYAKLGVLEASQRGR